MKRIFVGAGLALALIGGGVAPAFADDAPPPAVEETAPVVVEEVPAEEVVPPVVVEETPVVAEAPAVTVEEPVVEEVPVVSTDASRFAAAVIDVDYVTVAWLATEGDIWNPAQTTPTDGSWSVHTEDYNLDALDELLAGLGQNAKCGTTLFFQVDGYIDDDTTAELIAGGVLYGPSNPTEHLAHDAAAPGNPWKYVKVYGPECPPPPTNTICTTYTDGGHNGLSPFDTRTAGHAEYVADGRHIWTDDNSSQAKVSESFSVVGGSLSTVGTPIIDWTGTTPKPGLNIFVTFDTGLTGTLVWEEVYGGADWWLTNGSNPAIVAPQTGGGYGSARHGTIDEWLAQYPGATWATTAAYAFGSGIHGEGVIHSISLGCATRTFGNEPLPEDHSTYTEWTDEELTCENLEDGTVAQTRTRFDYTYTNASDGTVAEHASDPVVENGSRPLTDEEATKLHDECDTPPTTPPVPPVTTSNGLANTGLDPSGAIWAAAILLSAGGAIGVRQLLARRKTVNQ